MILMKTDLIIKKMSMGAFVGTFIILFLMALGSLMYGPENVIFTGVEVVNAFLGSIVVGWAFSFAGLIYEYENISFPLQVIIQMGIGLSVLFAVAAYLQWMPLSLGVGPIITWIVIAIIFALIFWFGFFLYYKLLARDLNKKIEKCNGFSN